MKALFGSLLLIGFLAMFGCNTKSGSDTSTNEEQKYPEQRQLRDNLAHKEIVILEEQIKPSQIFGDQIKFFFEKYLVLEEALVVNNITDANRVADEMKFLLNLIPEPKSDEKAIKAWKNHKEIYNKNLKAFLHANTINEKRSNFSHISEVLYCTLKSFEVDVNNIFVAFCPMAFDNIGAYWLTSNPEIRNPYFGDKMLKCGSITESIPN